MHADMTAVTIQSNKIILGEVRQLRTTRAILEKKTKCTCWPTQYIEECLICDSSLITIGERNLYFKIIHHW